MWLCLFYIIVDKYRPMVYDDVRVVSQNRERRNLHRENRWISRIMKATPTLTVPWYGDVRVVNQNRERRDFTAYREREALHLPEWGTDSSHR